MHRVILLALALAAGCAASLSGQMSATVEDTGATTYAAMDEVEVAGGELRLVTPVIELDVQGVERQTIGFPLRHTAVHAEIAGPMATYTIEQTFDNPFAEPIEAVYVFPLSDKAAVSAYAIQIGERTVTGVIKEREEARRQYAEARAAGHTAALLEQDKPDVFAQRIANIAPHETITVKLQYVELVEHLDGAYATTVPLVVGPRYLPSSGRVGRNAVGAHRAGDTPRAGATSVAYSDAARETSTVSFTAAIDAGVPILGVESPSHDLNVDDVAPTRVRVTLARADEPPDRDLIVRWRASGDRTNVGVLAHRTTSGDGHFVLVVQPKAEYRTGDVAPREVLLLIDVSGSMGGVPLEQARGVAAAVVNGLADRDTFNVLAFASGLQAMSETPLRGDAAGRARGAEFLASLGAGGGTELEGGILAALQGQPKDRVRMVYLLTDGWVGNDDVIIDAASGALGHNRIFTVGIGAAPNRSLLDRLAVVGRGFSSYLGTTEEANVTAGQLVRRSSYPYLTDVSVDWGGLDVKSITPGVIPDVYAGMPLIVAGKYGDAGRATVTFKATLAGKPVALPIEVILPSTNDQPSVASLWARHRIDELMSLATQEGIPDGVASELTELGLAYHLVTERTSFIAIDRTRVVSNGQPKFVEQPAATPEGVNLEAAVGPEEPSYSTTSYSSGGSSYDSSSWGSGGGGGGGWGGGGGGDADPWTLLLVALLAPIVWHLRRARA